ncbi:hypothetical protein HDE69_004796 [Pedobacter cryoconitis]|uniref:DNA-binding domain-containing protein n=1 Tax=Pedobacter cryoconitis TaxID=188932 RepID=A0A7W9DM97_9SPHI|nr:putative DNA-binding domain-containing protein [Pedobacter cryoconitis]MBB5623709.1 hypothetical protein [Pedobacter cryoconitis]
MSLLEQTHLNQLALASYCRTGILEDIPGINIENIGHYRRLVFNVIDDMLQSAFPLSHELLKAREWQMITHDFFSNHACQSPQVWYMPREFYEYLEQTRPQILNKYPVLLELLWFEWLEVELFMMEDQEISYSITGNIEQDRIILNPEIHFQHFNFPVHLKKAKKITAAAKGDYYLCIHRIPETGDVSFTDLSPAFVRLLELLSEKPQTAASLIDDLCEELKIEQTIETTTMCQNFILMAMDSRLIIGFKND